MCNTIVILLLGLGMFIAGTVMWIVTDDYFEIVDVNYVICKECVICFTISTLILFIGSAVTITVLICCFATNRHEFNSGLLITIFYTLAGIIAIITLTVTPVWLHRQSSIVQRFEESSEDSFAKQSSSADIRVIWDNYQRKYGCCGARDYKDYYDYFGFRHGYSVPMSCCNRTTLDSAGIECSAIIMRRVTENDTSSYYVYGEGCSAVITNKLKLNSTTVHDIGILAITGSVYILISIIVIVILTVIIVPEDNEQRFCFIAAMLIVLFAILKIFLTVKK